MNEGRKTKVKARLADQKREKYNLTGWLAALFETGRAALDGVIGQESIMWGNELCFE